ncbi:MAG: Rap1a/Tai family immunity protein [Gammaproteobacteria bacterium]|nr:Rap1a/Tai family immunity protein [Gammaproteobacteria bacterium]
MAEYCREYIKLIELKTPVKQLEAGICSGYIASGIEIMDLSGRLCDRAKINLNDVVNQYVLEVESSAESDERSATYVLVDVLQQQYSCEGS